MCLKCVPAYTKIHAHFAQEGRTRRGPWITKKCARIKKKIKISSYIRKFRRDRVQSHIWLTASSTTTKYLCISSYIRNPNSFMTFHRIPSEFPYIWGKSSFIFICVVSWVFSQNLIYFPISSSPCLFYIGQCNNNCKL